MPIYKYECSKGHVTEVRQTSFEPRKFIACEKCEDFKGLSHLAYLSISSSGFEIKNKPIGEKKWF